MKRVKRVLSLLTAGILAACLLVSQCFALGPSTMTLSSVTSVKHYNVVLVVDGSGSLETKRGTATDPDGYRYDAVRLFLGLMSNTGNYVSAVVFDDELQLNTEFKAITGVTSKNALADKIESAYKGGDTDIGGAVLTAVEKLVDQQAQNGLPSVVVLMSDGKTDLPKESDAALQESLDKEQEAVNLAASNNIPIYTVGLNYEGKTDCSGELQLMADGTGGVYQEVTSSRDLSKLYATFYSLIYQVEDAELENGGKFTFDEEGIAALHIDVPSFGVQELNLTASSDSGITSIVVTDPSGNELEEDDLDGVVVADTFEFFKKENPEGGTWTFEVHGKPGVEVQITLNYNTELNISTELADGTGVYESGETAAVHVYVNDGNTPITNTDAYNPAYLTMTLEGGGQSVPMTVTQGSGCFEASVTLPDVQTAETFTIYADYSITGTGMKALNDSMTITVNPAAPANNAPVALDDTITVDADCEINLDEHFSDPDGDALTYELVSSDYDVNAGEIGLADGKLTIAAGVNSGSAVVSATDGISAARMTVNVNGNNPPIALISGVTETVQTNKLFGSKAAEFDASEWFSDADGDPLTYQIVDCDNDYDKDGTVAVDGGSGAVSVRTSGFKKSNMVVRASDQYGAYAEVTVHFKTLNWWLIYGGIVIAIIAAIVVLLLALSAMKVKNIFKGFVRVTNTSGGFEGPGSGSGYRSPHKNVVSKLWLNSLSGVNTQGFSGKCTISPRGKRGIRFNSPTPVYYQGRPTKKVDIGPGATAVIFDDQKQSHGLSITAELPGLGGGFGPDFGGSFGGQSSTTSYGGGSSNYGGGIQW